MGPIIRRSGRGGGDGTRWIDPVGATEPAVAASGGRLGRRLRDECRRQQPQILEGAVGVGRNGLDRDVVRPGVAVLADAGDNRVDITPRDERVDQAVATLAGNIGIAEPHLPEVIHVVRQLEVAGEMLPARGSRSGGIGLDDHRLLRGQDWSPAEDRARALRVLGSDEIGMGTVGVITRQLQHSRAQSRDPATDSGPNHGK